MDTLNWGHPPSVGWRPAPRHPQSHCMPELPPAPTPPPPALSCHVLRWPPLCVTFRGSLPAQTIPSAAPRHWDSCAHCCKRPEPPSLTQPLAGGGQVPSPAPWSCSALGGCPQSTPPPLALLTRSSGTPNLHCSPPRPRSRLPAALSPGWRERCRSTQPLLPDLGTAKQRCRPPEAGIRGRGHPGCPWPGLAGAGCWHGRGALQRCQLSRERSCEQAAPPACLSPSQAALERDFCSRIL